MKTGKIRIAAWLTACFLLLCCAAGAEATLKETTRGGKVVRLEWQDENGAMTTGPEGYAYATRNYSGTTITGGCCPSASGSGWKRSSICT